jgi:ABC-2 type transport system permease protein
LRVYWEVARRSFRRHAGYRMATFAGAVTNTIFGFIKAYVFLAVYQSRDEIGGFTAMDAVTFSFVVQGFLMMVSAFDIRTEVAERIRTGDVVSDLYRPIGFMAYWFAVDVGRAAFQMIARGLPPVVAGAMVFDLRLPEHGSTWVAFGASIVLALLVSFGLRFAVSLWSFWLLDDRGPNQILIVSMLFFAGVVLPIGFFPDWLEAVARALPFSAMIQVPVEIFLEEHAGADLAGQLVRQAGWAIALLAGARALVVVATRKVVVQGG